MFGSLISALLLGKTSNFYFFVVMGCINLVACISFAFLAKPEVEDNLNHEIP